MFFLTNDREILAMTVYPNFSSGKRKKEKEKKKERNKRDVSATRYRWFREDVKRAKLRTGIVPRFDDPCGECGEIHRCRCVVYSNSR